MKTVSRPISVEIPTDGVAFAESNHSPRFRMAKRADPFHKLVYVLQGHTTFHESGGSQALPLPAGAAVCVDARAVHQFADSEPATLLLLCLGTGHLERDPALAGVWHSLTRHRAAIARPGRAWGARFEALWRAGVVEQTERLLGREIALRACAENMLVALVRLRADDPQGEAERRVANVVREIAGTFYEPWSLDLASAQAGMSRRHFSTLFRAQTGRTFLQHLTECRLNHATHLLEAGRHSIIGAAFSSGYSDLSHFYRLFRQHHGSPPREWLEKRRGADLHRARSQG